MTLRAKFKVHGITVNGGSEAVTLQAVYSSDPASENYSFSSATPSGTLTMQITNPAAHGFSVDGQEYYLDITPAAEAKSEAA